MTEFIAHDDNMMDDKNKCLKLIINDIVLNKILKYILWYETDKMKTVKDDNDVSYRISAERIA